MTELEHDLKTARKFASNVGHKTISILKQTLCLTKDYSKSAVNACYCSFKRVVKLTAELLRDDENNGGS